MVQAIVAPENVRTFSARLKEFNNQLTQMSMGIKGQFEQLGDTWRDREHEKFKEQFDETLNVIQRFVETSDEYAAFLIRKAEAADEYLNRR